MYIYIYIVVVTKGLKHCWGTAVVISSDGARNQTLLLFLVHPGAGPLRPDGPPSTFNHVSFSPPSNPPSRHERFLFPENDYADWKVQASGRGEIARSTMARERESERKEPEIIFLEFFSYLNSLHRSSLEINVQSTIRWNDFCEKILWL